MGLKSGQQLVDELTRRLTNLDRTTALEALNRAQKWCVRQGSFQFMMTTVPYTFSSGGGILEQVGQMAAKAQISLPMDPGKAKMVFNLDGTPIRHVPFDEFWQSVNYNIPTGTMYDTYTVKTQFYSNAPVHTFYFLPNVDGDAVIYYHSILGEIADGGGSYSELPNDFDDLLVDLAEAEERRIYDIGDSWQLLLQRSQEQIKLLLDGYRSSTQQETNLSDATVKAQETAQLGRN